MLFNQIELVALDLDGTLVDTMPDLTHSINKMLQKLSLPVVAESVTRDWVGNGIEQLVQSALTHTGKEPPNPDLLADAITIFLAEYQYDPCQRSRLYAGVKESLNYLYNKPILLACITNKESKSTDIILRQLGIYDVFEIIVSGDTLAKRKPDPLPLLHAAEYCSISPEKSLMVGDSISDVRAARAAGFKMICVDYGYNFGQNIRHANPDHVIQSFSELSDFF